jgi:hypothetical protein
VKSVVYNAARGDVLILPLPYETAEEICYANDLANRVQKFLGEDSRVAVVPESTRVAVTHESAMCLAADDQSRRAVLLHISDHEFVELLRQHRESADHMCYTIARYPRLPEDARLDGVFFNPAWRRVTLRFSHPSFAEVPDGAPPPDFDGQLWFTTYRLRPTAGADDPEVRP